VASLNATCHFIREATNAVLWTTVTLDSIAPMWKAVCNKDLQPGGDPIHAPAKEEAVTCGRNTFEGYEDWLGDLPTNRKYVR
jgi:hypothetical protein